MFRPNTGAARAKATVAALALAALLSGCATGIRSYNPTAVAPPPGYATAGFGYWLPKSSIDTNVGLVLTECAEVKDWDKFAPAGVLVPQPVAAVGFKLVGEINASTERGQQVQLDYRTMAQFLKTGSLKIERHTNGMLKSLNASLADESPEAIATAAKAAAAVAAAVGTGNPTLALAGLPIQKQKANFEAALMSVGASKSLPPRKIPISYETCSDEAVKLLAEAKEKSREADAADVAIDKALADVVSLLATPGGVGVKEYSALIKAQGSLKDAVDRKTAASKALKANMAKRTLVLSPPETDAPDSVPHKELLRWKTFVAEKDDINRFYARLFTVVEVNLPVSAQDGDLIKDNLKGQILTLETGSPAADAALRPAKPKIRIVKSGIKTLLDNMATASLNLACKPGEAGKPNPVAPCFTPASSTADKLMGEPRRHPLAICARESDKRCQKIEPAPARDLRVNMVKADRGILYVEPVKRKLVLQGPSLTLQTIGDELSLILEDAKPVATKVAAFPEQGQFWALPLRSGFGEKVALEATFAEDGSLVTGNFTKSASMGKAIADTAKNALEGIVAYREKQASLEVSAIEQQTKLLKAQKDQNDAAKALTIEEKSLIDEQIEALQKEKMVAEAKVAIAEATKKLNDLANPKP